MTIKTRDGTTWADVSDLIESAARRRRLVKAAALFQGDEEKQRRWILADVDKLSIDPDTWETLEAGVRNVMARTMLDPAAVEFEAWQIQREREDAEILAEADRIQKPQQARNVCEKCGAPRGDLIPR